MEHNTKPCDILQKLPQGQVTIFKTLQPLHNALQLWMSHSHVCITSPTSVQTYYSNAFLILPKSKHTLKSIWEDPAVQLEQNEEMKEGRQEYTGYRVGDKNEVVRDTSPWNLLKGWFFFKTWRQQLQGLSFAPVTVKHYTRFSPPSYWLRQSPLTVPIGTDTSPFHLPIGSEKREVLGNHTGTTVGILHRYYSLPPIYNYG